MNPSVVVLICPEITREELKDVLLKAGGSYDPGNDLFGLITHEERYIWIHTGKKGTPLSAFVADYLEALEMDAPEVVEHIRTKLGGEPRIYFELEIRRTAGSQQLAVYFVNMCAQIWPCVVVGSSPHYVFSKEEIQQLLKREKALNEMK
jgi:hypothetical protein